MKYALIICALLANLSPARAAELNIVTDIAPVGSLVSLVSGQDVTVLVEPGQSPHDASLKPSMAQALQNADLVIWMGHALLPRMETPIEQLAEDAEVLELLDLPDVPYLAPRAEAVFGDDHDHDHNHGHDHGDAEIDPHAWLSMSIASKWLIPIADALSQADPQNAGLYAQNAASGQAALEALAVELDRDTEPLRRVPMIALHDAFQYLEQEFQLTVGGAVTGYDGSQASAKRVSEVSRVAEGTCLLSDASETADAAEKMGEVLGLEPVALDTLGVHQPQGPALYADMMRRIAQDLQACTSS